MLIHVITEELMLGVVVDRTETGCVLRRSDWYGNKMLLPTMEIDDEDYTVSEVIAE